MTIVGPREADHPIDPMFLARWSPRAFTGESLPEADLLTMLEAGRWAASSYNAQPWRFLYARRDTPQFAPFLDLLNAHNQSWAHAASALLMLVSNTMMRPPGAEQDVVSRSHALDAGAASANIALQAQRLGWHLHGMVGMDMERAVTALNLPPGFRVEAAYAIGRLGDPATLPESLRRREQPSQRLKLAEIAFEGGFPPG